MGRACCGPSYIDCARHCCCGGPEGEQQVLRRLQGQGCRCHESCWGRRRRFRRRARCNRRERRVADNGACVSTNRHGYEFPVYALCCFIFIFVFLVCFPVSNSHPTFIACWVQEEPSDSPFFVQNTIVFKTEQGAAAYQEWFAKVAQSRAPLASMYLLTRTAQPLVFVQFEIYRSSAAFQKHQESADGGSGYLQGFQELKDSIDFEKSNVRVVGRVSEAVRLSLAAMGAVSFAKTAGHILLPGKADSDNNCVILTSSFRALSENKGSVYANAFEKVTPSMKPFASTYFQCKDPSDGITFNEVMVFRSLAAFEQHYCSRAIVDILKPRVRETLDMESTEVIAVGNIVASEAEEVRRALDGLNAAYLERVAGYAFKPAPSPIDAGSDKN